MAVGYPGGNGTHVPLLELSGNLMVSYARDLKNIPSNKYSRVTPVKNTFGTYLRFDPQDLVRQAMTNLPYGPYWAPGTTRPTYTDGTLGFEPKTFQCKRYNFGIPLDKLGVDLANWPLMKMHSEALAQEAITHRAYRIATALFNTSNYAASHAVSATTANGVGFLQNGTTAQPLIKLTLDYCARLIQKDTLGKVRWGNLSVVINHNTALRWSATREIREYLMQHADAYKMVTGDRDKNYNAAYGLPSTLYGYNLIIEDTFYNVHNPGGTAAPVTVVPDNKLVVCLAEGEQEQVEGGRSYSTVHVFAYEEMTVESYDDQYNRMTKLDVVMHDAVEVVAPPTGVVVSNLFE